MTACVLSFLALLGSVSFDLSSSFERLYATEAAHDELTSCRTAAVLQLVASLQKMRYLSTDNETMETSFPELAFAALSRVCGETAAHTNSSHGLPCSSELAGFCLEVRLSIEGFLKAELETNSTGGNGSSRFSLVIRTLLGMWGTVEDDLVKAKLNSNWRVVLCARLLTMFIELNHQLMHFPLLAAHSVFQYNWTHVLSYLGFARVMTEQMNDCWIENVDKLNSSQQHSAVFDTRVWQISGAEAKLLPGSPSGIEALTNTRQCLFDRAVPALRLTSRSAASGLSMRVCLLTIACLIYPAVMVSFKQMTEWIQNYAQNLKEKTEDLKRQRQLAEDLLHQMLPKSVAKQLRKHKHVEAESYEKVGGR